MGFLDKAKQKATDFANKNPDKVNNAIRKGADFIDKRTKGKYSDQIRKGTQAADQRFGRRRGGGTPPTTPPPTTPPPPGA